MYNFTLNIFVYLNPFFYLNLCLFLSEMSEVEEGAASIVTDTTRNSNEQFTPKILSHLPR